MHVRASKIRYRGSRADQQDVVSVAEIPAADAVGSAILAVLTDGIGGLSNGRQASELVNASVLQELQRVLSRESLTEAERLHAAMRSAAERANDALRDYQLSHHSGRCGTTLLVCVLRDGWLHFLSVGDSLLHALGGDSRLQQLNAVHTEVVEEKSYLASALLGAEIRQVDQASVDLRLRETRSVLLSSDGLLGQDLSRIGDILAGSGDRKLKEVVDLVHQRGDPQQDNLSMILMEIDGQAFGNPDHSPLGGDQKGCGRNE